MLFALLNLVAYIAPDWVSEPLAWLLPWGSFAAKFFSSSLSSTYYPVQNSKVTLRQTKDGFPDFLAGRRRRGLQGKWIFPGGRRG